MDTEAYNILLIDLERAVRRLADIDIMWSHRELLATRDERIEEAQVESNDLEQCKFELEYILDVMQQLKNDAA